MNKPPPSLMQRMGIEVVEATVEPARRDHARRGGNTQPYGLPSWWCLGGPRGDSSSWIGAALHAGPGQGSSSVWTST